MKNPRRTRKELLADMPRIIQDAQETAHECGKLLRGKSAELQGAVLMQLFGTFLAGHPPEMWSAIIDIHIARSREFAEAHAYEMFGPRGHPGRKQ